MAIDCKEIQPVHSEGDQPWDFFGRNDAKAETPVLRPPHVKSWLIAKKGLIILNNIIQILHSPNQHTHHPDKGICQCVVSFILDKQ